MSWDEAGDSGDIVLTAVDEEVGVIEHIVELTPELKLESLGQPEVFVYPAIEIPKARAPERIPFGHAGGVRAKVIVSGYGIRVTKRVGISQVYELDMIGLTGRVFRVMAAATERDRALGREPRAHRGGIRAVVLGERIAGVSDEDARELPAVQYLLGETMHRFSEWNSPVETDGQPVPLVKVGITVIQLRIEGVGVSQPKAACVAIAESRAEVIPRSGEGITGREP